MSDERSEVINYEVTLSWPTQPKMGRGSSLIRFFGTPNQLRTVMDCAEAHGLTVASVVRFDSMTAENAVKEIIDKLRPLAFIQQPSKLNDPDSQP